MKGLDEMKYSKELISGCTYPMLLSVIEKEDMHGYAIGKELARRSEGEFVMKEGTMYPILHALEKENYTESYWQVTEGGRRRKYYHITKKGLKFLADSRKEFDEFSVSVKRVLNFA